MSPQVAQGGDSDSRLRRAAALAVLNRLPYAVIVVDECARVLILNDTARKAASSGQGLRLEADVLRASDETEDAQLRASIVNATRQTASWVTRVGALRITLGSVEAPLLVLPADIGEDPLLKRRGHALVLFGGDARVPHGDLLAAMYGFTPREGDLVRELIAGRDLAEAARVLKVTVATARTHLKRVMEKTATGRQSDLIRLLVHSTAPAHRSS